MIFASLGCHFNKCILKNISQYIVMLHLRWVGIYNDLHIVLQINCGVSGSKNFDNMWACGKVRVRSMMDFFLLDQSVQRFHCSALELCSFDTYIWYHLALWNVVTHAGCIAAGVGRVFRCLSVCLCSKRKMAWAINTKLSTHVLYSSRSACIDPRF